MLYAQKGITPMKTSINLQDVFLNQARKEKVNVSIFLSNGFQLKGTVKGFDNFTIILESEDKLSLVYKNSIASIVPSKPLSNILCSGNNENE